MISHAQADIPSENNPGTMLTAFLMTRQGYKAKNRNKTVYAWSPFSGYDFLKGEYTSIVRALTAAEKIGAKVTVHQ